MEIIYEGIVLKTREAEQYEDFSRPPENDTSLPFNKWIRCNILAIANGKRIAGGSAISEKDAITHAIERINRIGIDECLKQLS